MYQNKITYIYNGGKLWGGTILEKFVEKFNIFDLFTMLIPGIIIMSSVGISLSFKWYDIWKTYGNEKYALFFIIAYGAGVLFQEIGEAMDKMCICQILYGGEPRKIFLSEEYKEKLFQDDLSYRNALEVKKYLQEYIEPDNQVEVESYNRLAFSYCLNICELNGISGKIDRMSAISEMSRALFGGCIVIIRLNIILLVFFSCKSLLLILETMLLAVIALVFLRRKKRFEQYKIRMMIRTFLIYQKSKRNSFLVENQNRTFD